MSDPNVHLHRELLDPALAPYMGVYFKQLRYMHRTGVRWFNRHHAAPDHFADLKIDGNHLHVRLWPREGFSYEFFTSEHVQDDTLGSPGHAHGIQATYVCGSATRTKFNDKTGAVLRSDACYSSSLTGGWPTLDCEAFQSKDTRLITWRSWQNQKFFEYVWHPNNDGKSMVTSTLAQAPGWLNQSGMYSPYCWARFGNTQSFISDYGLDVAPALYTKGGSLSASPALEHGWLYWRRAAVHSASGRQFFISTDNYGRFQIYPVKDYGALQYAVPASQYHVYTPPYPSWVTVPAISDFTRQYAQWLWRFNKDATKCVSIPFHSADTSFLKYLNNGAFFCAILPETSLDIVPQIALASAHEDTPGLVELGIEIEITGPGELDFVAHFTLLRSSYFEDDQRFYFDAGYFLKDVEKIGIAEDTLMTAEIDCRTPGGYYTAGPTSNAWATEAIDACRQLQADVVINANSAAMAPTEKFRFPAIGPAWFQFPTIQGYRDGAFTVPAYQAIPTTTGSRLYQPAGPGLYDPDSVSVAGRVWHGPLTVGVTYGFLYSLELTTLSLCYEIDDEVAGTASLRSVAYGKEFYRKDVALGYTLPAPTGILAATAKVPSFRPHQAMFNFVINTAPGDGFNVHPAGHWAFNLGGIRSDIQTFDVDLDWISVFKGLDKDGNVLRARYRHKNLFNGAFGQSRDYSFYHQPFPGEVVGDYGSFRTNGFWITFR